MIIGGHQRVKVWGEMGNINVPVFYIDLSLEKEKELNIRLNKNTGGWDFDLLISEFDRVELAEWGFEDADFPEVEVLPPDETTGDDEAGEPPELPITVIGDLYELGGHRLLCGDSTSIDAVEKLMDGQKADMVFTDPPYGVDYDGGHATDKRRTKLENDDKTLMYSGALPTAYMASKDGAALYLWFADRFAKDVLTSLDECNFQVRTWIIWNKNLAQFGAIGAQYKPKHEPCIYAFKKGKVPFWNGPNNEVTVWDVKRHSKNEFHPTQKPVDLPVRALENSSKGGDTVLDLFGGSGSTLIACEKTGRKCYMMELDPKYCDVIVKRYVNFCKENGREYSVLLNGEPYNEDTESE